MKTSGNRRIALNSIILYFKLIISVIVGLYTSRLVLQALGNNDFGLYSVVGGIVALLNIVGVTMVSTSYRFISVEIGKGSKGNPNKVYNTILVIHILLAVLLVLLGVTIGFWYVDNYLNVEANRITDAKYVLVVSLITTAITVMTVPSNGLIIAREKFLFTSVVEIFQFVLKLLLIYFVLKTYQGNRIRLYANLVAFATIIPPLLYTSYCYIKELDISKWKFNSELKDYSDVLKFTGWMVVSTLSFMGVTQGTAMILNIFFGTVVNAAFGIANQVYTYVQMAPRSVLQAASPQIMKSYGEGNQERSLAIVYACTKYCFFILLLVSFPCVLYMDEILALWLGDVPPQTSIFTSLIIIATLIGALTNGLDPLILASGKIRVFQIGYAVVFLSLLPIIYVLYSMGCPAYSNAIVMIILTIVSIIFQLYVASAVSDFKVVDYLHRTFVPVLLVVISCLPLFFLRYSMQDYVGSYWLASIFVSVLWIVVSMWLFGLNRFEKTKLLNIVRKFR